jgi:hypothetical protein
MGRQKILDQMVRGIPQILCALNSSAHAFWFIGVIPKYINFSKKFIS